MKLINSLIIVFSFFSCNGQIDYKQTPLKESKEKNIIQYSFPHIKKYQSGTVVANDYGDYTISFDKEGELLANYTFKNDSILNNYRITLNNSKIKFNGKYSFIIGNYTSRDDLTITLKEINSNNYELEFYQSTRHGIVDKIYFTKNNKGLLEINKMVNIQFGVSGTQTCFYNQQIIRNEKIDLAEYDSSHCIDEHSLNLLTGEQILIPKDIRYLSNLKIDSIQTRKSQIKADISNNCGEGYSILKNATNYISSKKIKDLIYKQSEPTTFLFTQNGEFFNFNMYDEKSVDIFCKTNKSKTSIIANIIIFKIYTPIYAYNLAIVDDIEKSF